jgi:DNA modification methylase
MLILVFLVGQEKTMNAQVQRGGIQVTHVGIEEIKAATKNPRRHPSAQIKRLIESIKIFGFVVPILVDRNGEIIAGHARYEVARKLGLQTIPVVRLEHLTDAQVKALRIADNRLTDLSEWDDQILAETLKDLSSQDLDFDIEVTGFVMAEIDLRIEGLSVEGTGQDAADDFPEPTSGAPVSKHGDIWRCGPHLIMCADSRSDDAYERLLEGTKVDMVFSDPPYNVSIQGHVSGKGQIRHREFAMASGELDKQAFTTFLKTCCALIARYSVDGAIVFLCMDWRHMEELLEAGRDNFTELKNVCVWAKSNAGMGSLYRSQHELVFVYKSGAASHRNNVQLGKYSRNRSNIWNYPNTTMFGRSSEEGYLAALHPTVKPVAMVADAILDCSARGEIVFDPFLGSGTTLIAAERIGRVCRGIEIDPLYVDTAIRRWQAYTGDKAVQATSGIRFDDVPEQTEASIG